MTSSNPNCEAEIAQIEAEVMLATEAWVDAAEAMDAAIFAGILHPTETSFAWNGTICDRPEWTDRFTSFMEPWERWEGGWTQRTVKVLSPKAAMFQGAYEATVHYDDGRVIHWPGNANLTALFELTTDGWKITVADFDSGSGRAVETG